MSRASARLIRSRTGEVVVASTRRASSAKVTQVSQALIDSAIVEVEIL
jgi:hypothetical protein